MSDLALYTLAGYAAQLVANLLLALVFFHRHRDREQAFLLLWAWGWVVLAIYHLTAGLALAGALRLGSGHTGSLAVSLLSQISGYGSVVLLVAGSWSLITGERLRRRTLVLTLSAVGLVATSATLLTIDTSVAVRLFCRVGLRSLFAGVGFLSVGVAVWRLRKPSALGTSLMSVGATLYGLDALHYFVTALLRLWMEVSFAYIPYMTYLDFLLQMAVGLGMAMWLVDVEHGQLEEAHLQLQQGQEQREASERLESIGRLAGGVAHDFNNLLMVIGGFTSVLRDKLGERGQEMEELEQIDRATERASTLTHQLLAFGRRQLLQPERLELNGLVTDVVSMADRLIGDTIRVTSRLDAQLPAANADAGQIQQVLLNLILNSRDAIAGDGVIHIETDRVLIGDEDQDPSLKPGTYCRFRVRDDGHGMDAETLGRVFEPFFSTKGTSGLGLSSAYGVLRQSGGDLRVDSIPGQGSTFTALLPAATERDRAVDPSPVGKEGLEVGVILVVEDDPGVRAVLHSMLKRLGYQCVLAANGREALRRLSSGDLPIDLVLADMLMPELNGVELARRLDSWSPKIPVVLMSGNPSMIDDELDPTVPVLLKPVRVAELDEAIVSAIGPRGERTTTRRVGRASAVVAKAGGTPEP